MSSAPSSSSSRKAKSSSSLFSLYEVVVFLRADDRPLDSTLASALGFVGVDLASLGLLLEAKYSAAFVSSPLGDSFLLDSDY